MYTCTKVHTCIQANMRALGAANIMTTPAGPNFSDVPTNPNAKGETSRPNAQTAAYTIRRRSPQEYSRETARRQTTINGGLCKVGKTNHATQPRTGDHEAQMWRVWLRKGAALRMPRPPEQSNNSLRTWEQRGDTCAQVCGACIGCYNCAPGGHICVYQGLVRRATHKAPRTTGLQVYATCKQTRPVNFAKQRPRTHLQPRKTSNRHLRFCAHKRNIEAIARRIAAKKRRTCKQCARKDTQAMSPLTEQGNCSVHLGMRAAATKHPLRT